MINYQKLCEIMSWERQGDQTWQDVFQQECNNPAAVPNEVIIDVVHAGGLEAWARLGDFESREHLKRELMKIFRITINSQMLFSRHLKDTFPPLRNFHTYCSRIDCNNKTETESERISIAAWYGELVRRRLDERTDKMFSVKPDKEKFEAVKEKIKQVWGFSDKDIDALRYFVCQTRHEKHNPSLNKSIYLWAKEKGTGKTTVARAIISVLNGEETIENAGEYESSFGREMQYNPHDMPAAVYSNAVLLDESMPKDSRKSYPQMKKSLTENIIQYNPKFQQPINIKVKRFYFLTSNDNISEFVQDESERRFYGMKLEKVPEQLSFEEIYEIWKTFCQNAEPEKDWQLWYNSFSHVEGVATVDKDEFKAGIINNPYIVSELENLSVTYIGNDFFYNKVAGGKATKDEKKAIRMAARELFEKEDYPSKYSRTRVIGILRKEQEPKHIEEDGTEEEDRMPF